MSRLVPHDPAALDPQQRELYDEIVGGPRASGPQLFALTDANGRLTGPFDAMLLAPALGTALQQLGAAIRYGTSLTPRIRELAILLVAARWDSAFERYAHEPLAEAAGVTASEIEAVRALRAPLLVDDVERSAVRIVLATLQDEDVDDEAYQEAVSTIGNAMVFELVTLVGYYTMLALQLRVFRVDGPGAGEVR